ncbi:MAG: hypothetical protein GY950_10890 [bacterium]|nr:hypothetical protein [bacterium]
MKKNIFLLSLSVFLFLAIVPGSQCMYAESISDKIQLNGFISQGYLLSTHNDFIPESAKNGSFEFSELGLTFSVDVSKKLRLGFQMLARDFGPIGNHKIELAWGFADYRFSDAFGLRVGKIKTPMGLYNEIRDTDPLFPVVILPQSIYDESFRSVFIAYNGIGIYGNLVGVGSLNYNFFVGGVNHPGDTPYLALIRNSVNRGLVDTGMSVSPLAMNTQLYYGGRLIWTTPIRGLRLGGTYLYVRAKYNGTIAVPFSAPVNLYGSVNLKEFFLLSGQWAIGNFTLSSEYMELPADLKLELFGQELPLSDETQQGWYIMGSYVFGDKLTLYVYYDRYLSKKGDTEGQSAVLTGRENFFAWQKHLVFGARYDINFNWTVKAEWHMIDGLAKSSIFFTDFSDKEQKWNMLAVKISYSF